MTKAIQDYTFEEIADHVEKLIAITSEDLDTEAAKNNKIFVELNRIYILRARKLAKITEQKKQVEFRRKRYYSGKETAEVYKKEPLTEAILKTDIPERLDIDPVVIEIRNMLAEEEAIVKFLEDAKVTIRYRGNDIKSMIEWRRLMMGM